MSALPTDDEADCPPDAALNDPRLSLIVESYQRLTGKPLIVEFDPLALWHAPCAILAHGTEEDPLFFYGNRCALNLFEMSSDEFVCMPSRRSAEPLAREARVALLEKVTKQGFVSGYSGMRITKSGTRLMITDVTIWNLVDAAGEYHGQAAAFMPPDKRKS